jgi:hypothetical protein
MSINLSESVHAVIKTSRGDHMIAGCVLKHICPERHAITNKSVLVKFLNVCNRMIWAIVP